MFTNIKLKLIFWQITTLYMYVRLLESNLSFCKIVNCVFINVLWRGRRAKTNNKARRRKTVTEEEEQEQIRQQENEEQEQIERQE